MTPYLGQVATNCLAPNLQNVGSKALMSRSRHIAKDEIKEVQIAFPNWVTRSDTRVEAGMGSQASIIASIEYPVGTFRQLMFSGNMTGYAPDGGTLLSDPCDISIPDGAVFYVRTWFSNPSGIVWSDGIDVPGGEAFAFSASNVADQTRGGTITSTDANTYPYCYRPVAVIGMTDRPSVLIIGDSRVAGVADTYTKDTSSSRGAVPRSLADNLAYINAGVSGDRAMWFVASHAKRAALAQYVSHVICEYGINDINGALHSAGQVQADLQTIYGYFSGKPVFQTTLEPYANSSDGFTTLAGQTPSAQEGQRVAVNSAIRGILSGTSGIIDVAAAFESSLNSGKWRVGWPDGALTTDGLHANPAGTTFFKNVFHISPSLFGG